MDSEGLCLIVYEADILKAMGCQVLAHTHTQTHTHHIDCLDFSHVPFIDIYSLDKWIWLYIILWIDKSTFHRISSSLWCIFFSLLSFGCRFGSIFYVYMCLCVCESIILSIRLDETGIVNTYGTSFSSIFGLSHLISSPSTNTNSRAIDRHLWIQSSDCV